MAAGGWRRIYSPPPSPWLAEPAETGPREAFEVIGNHRPIIGGKPRRRASGLSKQECLGPVRAEASVDEAGGDRGGCSIHAAKQNTKSYCWKLALGCWVFGRLFCAAILVEPGVRQIPDSHRSWYGEKRFPTVGVIGGSGYDRDRCLQAVLIVPPIS